jgi:hypothetical protein
VASIGAGAAALISRRVKAARVQRGAPVQRAAQLADALI